MLLQRVLTALLLAPLVIVLIALAPTAWFAAVVTITFLAALWEWAALSGLKSPALRGALLAVAALGFAALWMLRASPFGSWVIVIGVAWWLLAGAWLRHFAFGAAPTRDNVARKLLAGLFVTLPAWMALVSVHQRSPDGHWWTLLALLIVWAADIGAYFSGRTFGKRKLAAQISPGKTWAGAYGALVAGTLVMLVGAWLLGIRGGQLLGLLLLAPLTVAVSIVGDLVESLMKRHAKVKDSGTLFPGHGGLMDRLDSLFAALPVFAAGLLWLNI
ncbi:MAG TPA: phosphatidate cytidylyltransferase [Rhodanobacter sp.]|nr:phosphatidate cytidylyltransferase [Rhodanobacter sp.]